MFRKSAAKPPLWSRREVGKLLGAVAAGSALGALKTGGLAHAQTFPNRPISLAVGYPPGGMSDMGARLIAEQLTPIFGNVVVENRPGASGNIAAQYVARAEPDGHTLLLGATAEICINHLLERETNFNPQTDLVPIAPVCSTTHAIVASATSPYETLDDVLDAARAAPGTLSIATSGIGTAGHIAWEAVMRRSGVDMIHVPYSGAGPALQALMGDHVDCYTASFTAAKPLADANSIRILALTSQERISQSPELPTVREVLEVGEFDFPFFVGVFAPAGTPTDIVGRINHEIGAVFEKSEAQSRFIEQNLDFGHLSTAEYAEYIQRHTENFRAIIEEIGLELE